MKFPEILKNEREKANLKQSDLAKAVGVTRQTISLYEQGEREPKLETLCLFAKLFGLSLDYLMGIEGESKTVAGSYEEDYLLEMFRTLSRDNKEKVIAITKTLHDMDKKTCSEKIG